MFHAAPQILGLSSGEGHCSEVLAWVCSRVSLCVSQYCMSSDDIVWWVFFSVLHNDGECGQNDALCLSQDCRAGIGKLKRDAWHLVNLPYY